MEDILTKTLNLGMGAINFTKEKAEKFVEELVKRGQVPKQEASNVVEALLKRGEQETKEIKGVVGRWVHQALHEAGVATHAELAALEKRLAAVEERLGVKPEPECAPEECPACACAEPEPCQPEAPPTDQ